MLFGFHACVGVGERVDDGVCDGDGDGGGDGDGDPPSSQRSSVLGAKPHGSTCIPDDPTSTRTHLNTDLT